MKIGKVWTPDGIKIGEPNSKVGFLEVAGNFNRGKAAVIDNSDGIKGKVGTDNKYALLNADDYVLGNVQNPETGNTFAEDGRQSATVLENVDKLKNGKGYTKSSIFKNTVNLMQQFATREQKRLADLQKQTKYNIEQEQLYQANAGKNPLPKFDMGLVARSLPTVAGLTASLGQLAHWGKNKPARTNTYAENPYETRALSDLAKLRYNPYHDIQESQDAERRTAYANSQAGGMIGGQRYAGRIGLGIGAMRNAANVYSNAQQQNLKLDQNRIGTMLEAGNQNAARRQSANQFDYNAFTASHGAKTKGIERSLSNLLSAIYSGHSNEFKYDTWQDTADIYRQQVDNEQKEILARMKASTPTYTYQSAQVPRNYYNYKYFTPSSITVPEWRWNFRG